MDNLNNSHSKFPEINPLIPVVEYDLEILLFRESDFMSEYFNNKFSFI